MSIADHHAGRSGARHRRRAGRCALLLALLAAITACGPKPDKAASASDEAFNTGLTEVRQPDSTKGGTLRLVTGPVDSLDPTRSYQYGLWNLMRLYTRQLVTWPSEPGDAGTHPVPDLATGLGKPSNEGRTWTYTLKKGLAFEDGTPITSAEVKYGIERSFATNVLPGGPTWLVQLLDDPTDPYPGPYQDGDLYKNGLEAIQTPNAQTVVFHLNRPFGDLDAVLAMPVASPAAAKKDAGATYGARPLSSGPYKLSAAYAGKGTLTLVRNPKWSQDAVRTALPDQVQVSTGLAAPDRDARLLAGAADLDITGSGLQPGSLAQVVQDPTKLARADNPADGNLRLAALPVTVAPFDDEHCRRAVQYAVDKAAVKTALSGDYGATLATTLWPRSLPGYPATSAYPSGEGNHGDLAAAKRELAACGKPDGFSTRIAAPATGRGAVIAKELATALARVGIKAAVRPFADSVFLASGAGAPKAITDGGYGIVVVNWVADFPSPAAFYPPLLDGRNKRTSANTDYAQVHETALDALADQAAATVDGTAAEARWRQLDAAAMQRAVYVPLVEDKAVVWTGLHVRNALVQPVLRNIDLAAVGVG